ncbi:MAG TPA: S8 family serine peptidase [Pyrinomonadaceae bacterium]|nr:S8 family serine peptidase [Pyrinomonadaceae bacterium]
MSPSNRRALVSKVLALALVAAIIPLAPARRALALTGDGGEGRAAKVSSEIEEYVRRTGSSRVTVIVQLNGAPTQLLYSFLMRAGVRLRGQYAMLGSFAIDMPAAYVDSLANFPEIRSVTRDREVAMTGHVTATTGADAVRTLPTGRGNSTMTVDGTGVGIAVLDSGVYSEHVTLKEAKGASRNVVAVDFTGEGTTADAYGHGSHVASTAAGSDKVRGAGGFFGGIAPNATLVSLRVLDSQGRGRTSWVLAAINWLMAHGQKYRVRVVNLSLGAPAVDSYKTDPLCHAVRRLVDAGFVVVAAAGNDGKTSTEEYGAGVKTYGLIHTPGNEPSAITVGASNTFGTDDRRDDGVTTYSSRGPTRSFWTDDEGTKHYDNLLKPDLVAPGNKLVFAEALNNRLVAANPSLHFETGDAGPGGETRRMMYLSGTSVSAPVVAGAAALMLQVNPRLTPNLVKAILMYTAQPLAGFNMLEQGAGGLNIEGAVRLAKLVRTDLDSPRVGDPLLKGAAPAAQSTVAGFTFPWARGFTARRAFVTGDALVTRYQGVYARGRLLGDAVAEGDGSQAPDPSLMSRGIVLCDAILFGDGSAWGDEPVFLPSGWLLGDGIVLADGWLLGDGIVLSDGWLMADGWLMGDSTVESKNAIVNGDAGPAAN